MSFVDKKEDDLDKVVDCIGKARNLNDEEKGVIKDALSNAFSIKDLPKVADIIKELQKYPPDADFTVSKNGGCMHYIIRNNDISQKDNTVSINI